MAPPLAEMLIDRMGEVMKSCHEIMGQLRRRRESDRVCLTRWPASKSKILTKS